MAVAATGRLATVFTTRDDGDFNVDDLTAAELSARQQHTVALQWTMLRQVHGAEVVTVDRPGQHHGVIADAMVITCEDAVGAVWSGDCAPVIIEATDGHRGFALAHAGWKGIENGVLAATANRLNDLGVGSATASIGPYIHPCCYEFGNDDLARLAASLGVEPEGIAGESRHGTVALDVRRAITAALAPFAIAITSAGPCTGCDTRFFSHRTRGERPRHAIAVWRPSL